MSSTSYAPNTSSATMTALSALLKNIEKSYAAELGANGAQLMPDQKLMSRLQTSDALWMPCHKRHVAFAMAYIDFKPDQAQTTNIATWSEGHVFNGKFPKTAGDMLRGTYAVFELGALRLDSSASVARPGGGDDLRPGDHQLQLHWVDEIGHALMREVAFVHENKVLERLSSEQMHVLHAWRTAEGSQLRDAIGKFTTTTEREAFAALNRTLAVPLPFSYLNAPESAFPVMLTDKANLGVQITLRSRANVIVANILNTGGFINTTIDPDASIAGGEIRRFHFTNEVVYFEPGLKAHFQAQGKRRHYFEHCLKQRSVTVNDGDTEATVKNINPKANVVSIHAFFRTNAAMSALRKEYFNFGAQLSLFQRPRRYDASGSLLTTGVQATDPLRTLEYRVQGNQALVSRPAVFLHELQHSLYGNRVPRTPSYVHSFFFNARPMQASQPSGSLAAAGLGTHDLHVTFEDNNVTVNEDPLGYTPPQHSGIQSGGELFFFARAQNAYSVMAGGGVDVYINST